MYSTIEVVVFAIVTGAIGLSIGFVSNHMRLQGRVNQASRKAREDAENTQREAAARVRSTLQHDLDESRGRSQALSSDLQVALAQIAELPTQADAHAWHDQLEQLRRELDDIQNELHSTFEQSRHLGDELMNARRAHDDVADRAERLQTQLAEVQQLAAERDGEIVQIQNRNVEITRHRDEVEEARLAGVAQIDQLRNEAATREESLDAFTARATQLQDQNARLEAERTKAQDEAERTRRKLTVAMKLEERVTELEGDLHATTVERSAALTRISQMGDRLKSADDRASGLEGRIADLKQNLDTAEQTNRTESERHQLQMGDLRSRLNTALENLASARKTAAANATQAAAARADHEQTLAEERERASTAEARAGELDLQNRANWDSAKQWRQRAGTTEEKLVGAVQRLQRERDKTSELTGQLERANGAVADAQTRASHLEADVVDTRSELESERGMLARTRETIVEINARVAERDAELKKRSEDLILSRVQVTDLKAAAALGVSEIETLRDDLAKETALKKQRDAELSTVRGERSRLVTETSRLGSKLKQITTVKDASEQRVETLIDQLSKAREATDQADAHIEILQSQLEGMLAAARGLGLQAQNIGVELRQTRHEVESATSPRSDTGSAPQRPDVLLVNGVEVTDATNEAEPNTSKPSTRQPRAGTEVGPPTPAKEIDGDPATIDLTGEGDSKSRWFRAVSADTSTSSVEVDVPNTK